MKKRALTLLEIIIVIFLITLITGAIGYSMKGTLEKGRAFRTEQAMEQLHDLLLMCLAEGDKPDDVQSRPAEALTRHGLAKNPSKIVEDGWGQPFKIEPIAGKTDFKISSQNLKNYNKNKKKAAPADEPADEE